ncbi:long-chain fatty acid--CoA ligase [Paenibacillus sp. LHD-38]|uniref:long-chain-fatty-acid--CoA ligase n=1 Tax=Paenibacillus sp. LHD-38 TaxID=3072143 RepID=UPI00281048B2|nr:long-chain fatty acid--CoA ligase [Paenibacillus sp. LHD-38]MDQ8736168.1 long-chain fatty acid--CoA ligase [Paenibacillus sp. LHD-38]
MEPLRPEDPSLQGQPSGEAEELARPWLRHYPKEVSPSQSYPDQSIVQFLINAALNHPNHPAVHFLGKIVTYRELYESAKRLASGLLSLGIAKGDRVAIMLPNCPQTVIAYYGVLFAGGVVVQTNPLYVERELELQLTDSGAVAIITVDLLYPRLARVRGERPETGPLPQLRHAIVTSIKDGLPFPKSLLYPLKQRKEGFRAEVPYGSIGVIAYKKLLAGKSLADRLPEPAKGADLAALQYTGGTTGTPKGVMLTHRNLVANTMQTSAWCYKAEDAKERFLAALPLFHVFGLTVLMNMSVLRSGTLILLPRFEVEMVLQTISQQKPTIFPGAPTMYVALIHHKSAAKTDLSSINVCISGSAALPLEVQEKFEALTGGRLIEGYGLSEASPVTHANPIWGMRKIGTIGVPFPDTEAAVIDPETGARLPVGELGELIVRGPQVMKGYWNKPAETDQVLRDGWLYTGDLATMDKDGYFTIMDRIKDVIIAGGFNIYPREVEEVLFEHPAVREAAVIGVKDEYRGESVKAYIVFKEGWHVSRSQLDRWCRERLAAYKVPHHYSFRETLPKTIIGKVLRRKLQEEEAEEQKKAKEVKGE